MPRNTLFVMKEGSKSETLWKIGHVDDSDLDSVSDAFSQFSRVDVYCTVLYWKNYAIVSHLSELELSCRSWNSLHTPHICAILEMPSCVLTSLGLSRMRIKDVDVQAIAMALQRNDTVQRLNLGCSRLEMQGFRYLANYLKFGSASLRELNLSGMLCDDDAKMELMLRAVLYRRQLKSLNLFYSIIGTSCLPLLGQCMSFLKELDIILLYWHADDKICVDPDLAIEDFIGDSKTLDQLWFSGNDNNPLSGMYRNLSLKHLNRGPWELYNLTRRNAMHLDAVRQGIYCFALISKSLGLSKDMRLYILSMVWASRFDALNPSINSCPMRKRARIMDPRCASEAL